MENGKLIPIAIGINYEFLITNLPMESFNYKLLNGKISYVVSQISIPIAIGSKS